MQTKTLIIESMDDTGTGLARIAQLSAIDNDGDTYQPGAFNWKDGGHQWASMLTAHRWHEMPWGKARVYEEGGAALAELNINLDTQAGRDWHAALKFDLAKGDAVVEWSYGYDVLEADYEMRAGQRVRVLKKLDVHEVSPVLRAAGIGTGTLGIKGAALKQAQFNQVISGLADMAAAIDENPAILSATGVKQLGDIHERLGGLLTSVKEGGNAPANEPGGDGGVGDRAIADFLYNSVKHHLPQN